MRMASRNRCEKAVGVGGGEWSVRNSYCKWRQLMMATKHKTHLPPFTATQHAMAKSKWPQQQDQQRQQQLQSRCVAGSACRMQPAAV